MAVEAKPHKLLAKLTMSLTMSGYRKNMKKTVDALTAYCEAPPEPFE